MGVALEEQESEEAGRGCWTYGGYGHDYRASREKVERKKNGAPGKDSDPRCFVCRQITHLARGCPERGDTRTTRQEKINAVEGTDQESL